MAENTKNKLPITLAKIRQAAIDAHQNDNPDKAHELYRIYLQNQPKDAAIWSNLGALFRKENNHDLAVLAQKRALELDQTTPMVMNNAANAFYDAGHLDKALELREEVIRVEPENPDHYTSLGKCYRGLHHMDAAEEILRVCIRKFPDFAEAHIQLAFVLLAKGNYPDGFNEFNWRWQGDEISLPDLSCSKWGGENLQDKTIFLTPEQGFGDTILMARFIAVLKRLGPQIKMAVKPPLRRIFTNLNAHVEFIETKQEIEACDYWAPMMDLPLYLNTKLENLPNPVDLFVPDDAVERAKKITAPYKDRYKIGVMWSGSTTYRANHKRSFDHRKFLELCDIPNVQLFSLYKGPLIDDYIKDGTSSLIVNAANSDRDFADSAALMQELDLVVSMDSAIVHIAGSLGIEVWNLLHSEPYWLYGPFKDHTPWYPSMRLITQETSGDWDGVFAKLKKDITVRMTVWKAS